MQKYIRKQVFSLVLPVLLSSQLDHDGRRIAPRSRGYRFHYVRHHCRYVARETALRGRAGSSCKDRREIRVVSDDFGLDRTYVIAAFEILQRKMGNAENMI